MPDYSQDFKFESEMRSDMRRAVYDAISDVCFKWRNHDFSEDQIIAAVDNAVDLWCDRFFESYDEE